MLLKNKYLNISNNAYDNLILIYYMNLVLLAYFFRNIIQVIFAKLRNKSWMFIKEDLIISFAHLFLTFIIFYRHYATFRYQNPSDPRYYKHDVIFATYSTSFLSMTEVLAYLILIQWIRVIFIFRVNSTFGPMLTILTKMIIEISKFLLIYLMFFLIFSSSGRLLFNALPSFKDNTSTILTLFSASLGNFSFSIFKDPLNAVSLTNSYIYLALFLLISNVILLNFIIAILTSIYEVLKSKSKVIYLAEIVKCQSVFGFNEYYSSMISLFIPLNLFFLPLAPLIFILKSKKLNLVLLHISYIPVLIIGTAIFGVCSVMLIPFAYIALQNQNIKAVIMKGLIPKERGVLAGYMVVSLFKDPAVLFLISIINTIAFTKSLYATNLIYPKENAFYKITDLRKLDKKYFSLLKDSLKKYKNTLVDIRKLIRDLRIEMQVVDHVKEMIYSYKPKITKLKFDSESNNFSYEGLSKEFSLIKSKAKEEDECNSLFMIKQFNLLKKFISYNSIPFDLLTYKKQRTNIEKEQNWSNPAIHEEEKNKPFEYDLDAIKKFKKSKIKKRRVVDASKLLKMIAESEEQSHFKYILNCRGVISIDKEINKKKIEINLNVKEKVPESDFVRLKNKLKNSKDPKIYLMNIKNSYKKSPP